MARPKTRFVRHADRAADREAIVWQSRRGRIWALVWTWRKHRLFLTKKEALHAQSVWRRWQERRGLRCAGRAGAVIAYHDGTAVAACVLHEYGVDLERK